MRRLFAIAIAAFFPIVVCLLVSVWWFVHYLDGELNIAGDRDVFLLKSGTGFSAAVDLAAANGWVTTPAALKVYGRLFPEVARIKAGEYAVVRGTTVKQWLAQMQRGEVISYQTTLVEGRTLAQALAQLNTVAELDASSLKADSTLWEALSIASPLHSQPEGLFFPDTYRFHRGDNVASILRRAYDRMGEVLAEEWQGRADDLPYETPYEALIMASIVEKETGLASEREQIAGVFVRRLQKKMRLQTDPTVIYGMGENYDGNLRSADLRNEANPYNSYRHGGLPTTPIALPGREAIHAALHPAAGDALYFVAKGDGSHHFSATLDEHEAAVRKYQLRQRRSDYRSAPPVTKSGAAQ